MSNHRVLATLALLFLLTTTLCAQPKKETKDEPPRVILAMPMAVEIGKKAKIVLRGLKIDTVTEVRFQEPRTTGKLLGDTKKIPLPNNANVNQVGDSEISIEVIVPQEVVGSTISFSVVGPNGESKPHSLIVKDDIPIVVEKEPNDGFRQAQTISLPVVIEGSIKQAQDVDVFRFEGKKGAKIHVELQANRFGSPVDGMLTLYDEAGRIIATADDSPVSLDPLFAVELPRDGVYYLSLLDAHDQGGGLYLYRLIVR